jgi:hypothetical protein
MSPHDQSVPTETSPLLVFTTVVLALLLAMLETDLHQAELHTLGLMTDGETIDPLFISP